MSKKLNRSDKIGICFLVVCVILSAIAVYFGFNRNNEPVNSREVSELDESMLKSDVNTFKNCMGRAEKTYEITDSDWAQAENNIYITIDLLKKTKNKYETQIGCYNQYDLDFTDPRVVEYMGNEQVNGLDWLYAQKNDIENKIETTESMLSNQKYTSPSSNNNVHCTSRGVGASVYTDCY